MNKVIVTGARGFIGSAFINKLLDENKEVVAIDIKLSNEKSWDSKHIKSIAVGLDNIDKLEENIPTDNYDAFYHFAWQGVNGDDKLNPTIQLKNIQMAMNCAIVAKRIGCKRFLCAGTIAERAIDSLSKLKLTSRGMLYGAAKHCTHLMLETFCKSIGLDFIWMQFSNIYGPANKTGNLLSYTIEQLFKGEVAAFGSASQAYDFIYIDDLIEAIYRLGDRNLSGNCYFIGSGEPRLLKEFLYEVGEKCGRRDLIGIGIRPDDGIVYTKDMFDIRCLVSDIGSYASKSFSEGIGLTIDAFK